MEEKAATRKLKQDSHAARSVEEKAATSKLMKDIHAARSVEEKAATSELISDKEKAKHAARSVEGKAATNQQRQKTNMQYCTYAVVEVGTGILLLDGLKLAAIFKEIFDLPSALKTTHFHTVRTYDMRDCY